MPLLDNPGDKPFQLDQRLRWSTVIRAVEHGVDGWKERLDAEAARDASDRGRKALLQAQVAGASSAALLVSPCFSVNDCCGASLCCAQSLMRL